MPNCELTWGKVRAAACVGLLILFLQLFMAQEKIRYQSAFRTKISTKPAVTRRFSRTLSRSMCPVEVITQLSKICKGTPAKDRIMHADFLRVQMDQAITVEVPLHFTNEDNCIGVKQDGGMISHVATSLEISCLPGALPEYIEIDVAELKLGDSIHMSEIVLPEGVEIPELAYGEDHDQVVVAINATRATAEDDARRRGW
jgi:ribosomal protein bL25 (Ctc-form)